MEQDAASLSVAILKKKLRGRIFLGCDNHPVSRLILLLLLVEDKHPHYLKTLGLKQWNDRNLIRTVS